MQYRPPQPPGPPDRPGRNGEAPDGGGDAVVVPHQGVQRRAALKDSAGGGEGSSPPRPSTLHQSRSHSAEGSAESSTPGSGTASPGAGLAVAHHDQGFGLPGEAFRIKEGIQCLVAGIVKDLEDQRQPAAAVPGPGLPQQGSDCRAGSPSAARAARSSWPAGSRRLRREEPSRRFPPGRGPARRRPSRVQGPAGR